MQAAESACHRDYFYVGGTYVEDEEDPGQRVMQGQMYVEELRPINGVTRSLPLVFIHGRGQTGVNWLNTPDSRKGWASYFVDQGYEVFLVDCPTRGRSNWQKSSESFTTVPVSFVESYWTAAAEHKLWPQAYLHTQWPGTGRAGDPIFDAFYASNVPSLANIEVEQNGMKVAGISLLDRIGPAILITHSQGGPLGWLLADARPHLVKIVVAIEPSGPPFLSKSLKGPLQKPFGITDVPLTFDPPLEAGKRLLPTEIISSPGGQPYKLQAEPARRLINMYDTPVLLVTAEASYHAEYDEYMVKFLQQAGVKAEWLRLAEHGIKGNGHMMFLELNNLEIARLMESYIARLV